MAFALWTLGKEGAWAILGDGLDSTTEDGIAIELRAFAMTMFKSGASDKPIGDLVDHVLARKDQLPSAIQLLSSAVYVVVSTRKRIEEIKVMLAARGVGTSHPTQQTA
jgi:hypothetical protein